MAVALASAGVAYAALTKLLGGTTQLTASSATAVLLTSHHIGGKVVDPATRSGLTITFLADAEVAVADAEVAVPD